MKARIFDVEAPFSILGFLGTFKFESGTNNIHEETAMSVISHYEMETKANTLNSCMCTQNWIARLATSLRNEQLRSLKFLRSCPEMINYLLQKYATDQALAEYDATILRYVALTNMTTRQFSGDLIAKHARSRTWMKNAHLMTFLSKALKVPSAVVSALTVQNIVKRI